MYSLIKNNKYDLFFENLICFSIVLYIFTLNLCSSVLLKNFAYFSFFHNLMYLSFITVILKITYDFFRGKFTYVEFAIYLFLGLSSIYIKIVNGFGDLLVFYIYIIACINVNKDKFLKVAFWSLVISLLFVVVFGNLPMFPKARWLQHRHGIERYRYGLGYSYTTYAPNFLLGIAFTMPFVIKKYKLVYYILLLIADFIIYILTDTKSAFICVILIIVLDVITNNKKWSKMFNFVGIVNVLIFALSAISIYALCVLYSTNTTILSWANEMLTGRLALAYKGISTWGIHPFGIKTGMSTSTSNYTYVDSSYINILLNHGYITLITVIIIFTLLSYVVYRKRDKKMILFLLVLAIHSAFDPQLILIAYNPVLAFSLYYIVRYFKKIDV